MADSDLTAARVREILHYNPETGEFTTVGAKTHRRRVGFNSCGYQRLWIQGKNYRAHRIAWLYMTGNWPSVIDHINGDGCDNRWVNLRDVSVAVNNQNVHGARHDSNSGLLGVSKSRSGKFTAVIKATLAGRVVQLYLGAYEAAEDAAAVYLDAKRRLHEGCTI